MTKSFSRDALRTHNVHIRLNEETCVQFYGLPVKSEMANKLDCNRHAIFPIYSYE